MSSSPSLFLSGCGAKLLNHPLSVCGKSVFVPHSEARLPREPRNVKSPWAQLARPKQVRTSLARIFFPVRSPYAGAIAFSSSLILRRIRRWPVHWHLSKDPGFSPRVPDNYAHVGQTSRVLHLSFALNPVTVIIYRELSSLRIQCRDH